MWQEFFVAIALVFIIEGLLPFAMPERWQATMRQIAEMSPRAIRVFGALSMVSGLFLLYWLR